MRRLGRLLIATISTVSIVTMVITYRGRRGYRQGRINKGRSPQNCIERGWVSAKLSDAILRDDVLICFIVAVGEQGAALPQVPLFSVAIKASAEQVYLLCRAAATKRSVAHLKGGLEGL